MWPDPSHTPLHFLEFNKHLDALLITGEINPDILGMMDRYQQRVMNEVKKSVVRISSKV